MRILRWFFYNTCIKLNDHLQQVKPKVNGTVEDSGKSEEDRRRRDRYVDQRHKPFNCTNDNNDQMNYEIITTTTATTTTTTTNAPYELISAGYKETIDWT